MKRLLAVVAAVLALGSSGCSSFEVEKGPEPLGGPVQPKEQEQAAKVGDTVTLRGVDKNLQVAVTLLKRPKDVEVTDGITKSKKNHRFVGVQLSLENVGTVVYEDALTNGSSLLDTKDQGHDMVLVTEIAEGPLVDLVKLEPGKSRKGYLVFEVPKGARPASFRFALDIGLAPQTGRWDLT